jgi:hypothetical protein
MAAGDPDYAVIVDDLSLLEVDIGKKLIKFGHGLGHRSDPRLTWLIGADGRGISPVEDLERRLPD